MAEARAKDLYKQVVKTVSPERAKGQPAAVSSNGRCIIIANDKTPHQSGYVQGRSSLKI